MSKSNNHKSLVVVIIALFVFLTGIYLTKTLPNKNVNEPLPQDIQIPEESMAQDVLETYFMLLSKKDYINAIKFHGSGYDYIISLNPDIGTDDYVSLLEAACEMNGFICMEVYSVVLADEYEDNYYTFTVQFKNREGELHLLPALEEIGQFEGITDHLITVAKVGDEYIVTTPLIFYP